LYVNAAGGIRVTEVGVELALACALYSARTGLALPADLAIAGELSLTGEIRPVRRLAGRVKTASNLGYNSFLGPASESQPVPELRTTADIKSAIKLIYGTIEKGKLI
jgi:DNA repair protein RadA/Sms